MKSVRWSRSRAALVALLVPVLLAGCGASEPAQKEKAEEQSQQSPEPTPDERSGVTLADLTDQPSVEVAYPTIKVPEGATPFQVDWMVKQLLPAVQRSLQVEELSGRSEREAVAWILDPFQNSGTRDRPAAIKKTIGKGYSFLLGNRFAPDAQPTGPVHVLGQQWDAVIEDNVLRVKVGLELAIPFEDGVAVVRRELGQSAGLDIIQTDGTFVPGYFYGLRSRGIDMCAVLTEGAARPGDLSEVAEELDALTARKPGGLSEWALSESERSDPAEERKECAAKS